MRSLAMFVLAFWATVSATTGPVRAAEPVESAVAGWIAELAGVPGWTATYGELAYDQATDTARLTGLKIEYAAANVAIAFDPISITGYVERPDGTFGVGTVIAQGATVKSDTAQITIADVRLDNLGNVPKDFGGAAWDGTHPFTSMMRAYARMTDIHMDHGGVGSVAAVATTPDGDTTTLAYKDFAMDGWADGKVARAELGAMTIDTATQEGPVKTSIAGIEARDIDYAAMRRVYDPDQYASGVIDHDWHTAIGSIAYGDIVVDNPVTKVTVGGVTLADFKVRQPERSIAAVFDRVMLDPQSGENLTPEDEDTLLGFVSAFSLGRLEVHDVAVDTPDGNGQLGGAALVDLSSDGLGEFSTDGLDITATDAGAVKVGHFALGGIVFPSLKSLMAASQAEQSGEEIDYGSLAMKLGFVEAADIDVTVPDGTEVHSSRRGLTSAIMSGRSRRNTPSTFPASIFPSRRSTTT